LQNEIINTGKKQDFLEIKVDALYQSIANRDERISHLKKSIVDRDRQIVDLNQSINDRDRQIVDLNQSINDRERLIQALYNSTSWLVSSPVRIIGHQLKRIRSVFESKGPGIKRSGVFKNALKKIVHISQNEDLESIQYNLNLPEQNTQNTSVSNITEANDIDYAEWLIHNDTLTDESRTAMRARIEEFTHQPLISVVMPVYNSNHVWLIESIESVRKQIYPNWELCIADDNSTDNGIRTILEGYAKNDSRIKVVFREKNGHISEASNSALEISSGEWIALLDHDDLLAEHALFWVAETINSYPQARLIYSDEDRVDEIGSRSTPFFKPCWSPHLMLSQAYLGHLVCYQKSLIEIVGGFDGELNGSQDYALALACIANIEPSQVQHIPRILYHWRNHVSSTSQNPSAKPYAHKAGLKAVESHIKDSYSGLGIRAVDGDFLFTYKLEFELPSDLLVSIIIPTKDGLDYLKPCIDSIFHLSTWENLEVLILDNGSEKLETIQYLKELQQREPRVRIISAPIPFNWSKLNNIGASHALGSILIFLNNDTQVISPSWIESMSGFARMPNVGTVGALLLFEDGTIQHSGVVVGMGGWADHVFRTRSANHITGPFVSPIITRNVLAVTGACVAISRERFDDLGGFDESFIICGSDVELGLRAHQRGFFNVMCAEAKLFHYESKTRSSYIPPEDFIQSELKYAPYRQEKTDPYYNPNLSMESTLPSLKSDKSTSKGALPDIHISRSPENEVHEARLLNCRKSSFNSPRLNLLLPGLSIKHVFGGISTALSFFETLGKRFENLRIIITDEIDFDLENNPNYAHWDLCSLEDDKPGFTIVPAGDRQNRTLAVGENDRFIATIWWSAILASHIQEWQFVNYRKKQKEKFVYLIQDFEPGFYPWSSRYALAESTYHDASQNIAVFNSSLLKSFFDAEQYSFFDSFVFEPTLHPKLRNELRLKHAVPREKRVLIYGRPGTDRNAFQIIVMALRLWVSRNPENDWEFVSAGEEFPPIFLGEGKYLNSLGKLSLEEYANELSRASIGISLMISPHPSYPPLEMAAFGIYTITNKFKGKDLSLLTSKIVSIDAVNSFTLSTALDNCMQVLQTKQSLEQVDKISPAWVEYLESDISFESICKKIYPLIFSKPNF